MNQKSAKTQIGRMIKQARLKKQLTQYELAIILGSSQSFLSKVENGVANINLEIWSKLVRHLNLNSSKFVEKVLSKYKGDK